MFNLYVYDLAVLVHKHDKSCSIYLHIQRVYIKKCSFSSPQLAIVHCQLPSSPTLRQSQLQEQLQLIQSLLSPYPGDSQQKRDHHCLLYVINRLLLYYSKCTLYMYMQYIWVTCDFSLVDFGGYPTHVSTWCTGHSKGQPKLSSLMSAKCTTPSVAMLCL